MSDVPGRLGRGLAKCRDLAAGQGSAAAVKAYPIVFTVVVTAVFVGLVSAVNVGLQARKARNRELARQRVLLQLLDLVEPGENLTDRAMARRYEERVERVEATAPDGGAYAYFRRTGEGPALYALPLSGRGFWGPIRGYLAVNARTGEITGLDFTRHEETPGLGGRISEREWQRQLEGIPYDRPFPDGRRLRVVQDADDAREIDAITGATGTSVAVEQILNDALARFVRVRDQEASP